MGTVTISQDKLNKVMNDIEVLIEDFSDLIDQDQIVKKRINEIEMNPSIGRSEKELDDYLRKRGVKIE